MGIKKNFKNSTIKYNINADYLLIVESPSKCSKIENFLGINYACIASIGHLQTLNGLKSIDSKNNYKPNFSIITEKKGHINQMSNIISKFSKNNIFLATDDDREGEAIAWHICMLFNLDIYNTKRIIFHEITKNAVINAVNNPVNINLNLVYSQFSRQILDIIVGFKVSPFLWKYLYNYKDNSLSAGRCQTPALRLIYDSYQENNDKYELKYKVSGEFTHKKIEFNLNKSFDNEKTLCDFLEKSKNFEHKINIGKKYDTESSPPKPFSTSRLLQVAGNLLNLSPKQTMLICQKLYQAGYITYMRTESNKYSSVFINTCNLFISSKFGEKYIGDTKKITNFDVTNPHEAIRVTSLKTTSIVGEKDAKLNSLYKLIYSNTVESCMSNYTANVTCININSPYEHHTYEFKNEIPRFLGWKAFKKNDNDSLLQYANGLTLFFTSINNTLVNYNFINSIVSFKNNNYYYTEHSLINKLESLGIGRPSTYASIVDTIQERHYVEKRDIEGKTFQFNEYKLQNGDILKNKIEKICGSERNKLVITNLGVLTLEFLCNNFNSLFSYEYTKEMENKLDEIAKNETNFEKTWFNICEDCDNDIKNFSKNIKNIEKCSFPIDDKHEIIFERFGPCVRTKDENGEYKYFNINPEIEINLKRLKEKDYEFSQIIVKDSDSIGEYNGVPLNKKMGRYGPYVEYNNKNISLKSLDKSFSDINKDDIIKVIEGTSETANNILREFSPNLSVRKGKYGAYAYYKNNAMKKPTFFNIKKFPNNFLECEKNIFISWLNEKYNMKDEDFV